MIPQLQLVFLRGHCHVHAWRCERQMLDVPDVTIAVASRGRSAHGGDELMGCFLGSCTQVQDRVPCPQGHGLHN